MTKVQTLRSWAGAILALLAVLYAGGHANAVTTIAFAMPMAVFFVCAAAYSTQKQIAALEAQVEALRAAVQGGHGRA